MLQYLKFSVIAFLPINVINRSIIDIVNLLLILVLLMIAETFMAFLLFSNDLAEFGSLKDSFI